MGDGGTEDCALKEREKKSSMKKLSEVFPILFTYVVENEEDKQLWKKMRIMAKKSWVDHHYPLAKSGPGWCRAQVMPSRWKPKTHKTIMKQVLNAADMKKIKEIVIKGGFCSSVEEVDAKLERTFPEIEKEIEKTSRSAMDVEESGSTGALAVFWSCTAERSVR